MSDAICSIEGCQRPARFAGKTLCGMHYQRRRNGVPMHLPPKGSGVFGYPTCSVEGCDRRVAARGLCGKHYQRALKGTPMDAPGHGPQRDGCVVEGCKRKHNSHGYCAMHNMRLARRATRASAPSRAAIGSMRLRACAPCMVSEQRAGAWTWPRH